MNHDKIGIQSYNSRIIDSDTLFMLDVSYQTRKSNNLSPSSIHYIILTGVLPRNVGAKVLVGTKQIGEVTEQAANHIYEFSGPASGTYVQVSGGSEGVNLAEIEIYGTLGMIMLLLSSASQLFIVPRKIFYSLKL